MRCWSRIVPAVVFVALPALAACGGDDGGGAKTVTVSDGGITVEARDNQFDVATIKAAPGNLDITLADKGKVRHTLVIDGIVGFKLQVPGGGSNDAGTVELDAGEYEFFCDVPGHRAQGMEGKIVVE